MESGVTETPEDESRVPKAPEYVVCVAVATFAVTAGIFLRSIPPRSVSVSDKERLQRLDADMKLTAALPMNAIGKGGGIVRTANPEDRS
jgi:hypothetical protein